MSKESDIWFKQAYMERGFISSKSELDEAYEAGRALGRDEGLEEAAQRVFDDDSACIAREGCANIDKMKAHLYTAIRALKGET